ncbi:MAG: phosphatidate cytidylyltransferase [Halocynthiibacter sp.]|jgi:phosphatidate cytidylyltransferase
MSPSISTIFELFTGLILALIGLSIIAMLLQSRLPEGREYPSLETLNARIKIWWGMLAFLALALLAGRTGVVLLFAFCSFAVLREFLTLTLKNRGDHWVLVGAFFFVLPLQYLSIWMDWYGFYTVFIPVYVFLGASIIAALRGYTAQFLGRVSETQWALMIAVFCVSHVPALLSLDIPGYRGQNLVLIAYLVVIVQVTDVLQYAFSRLFRGHLVAPEISSTRTWEGYGAAALCGAALGAFLFWMTPFSPFAAFALSLATCLVGFFGNLVMTAVKRDRGVKDWGHLIEGHGGFLDKFDGVIFAAPIFFHLVRFFYAT